MPQNNNIHYALTLTTGDNFSKHFVNKNNSYLEKLLRTYSKYFKKLELHLEILDKTYLETKIHYHGYLIIEIKYLENFNKFIRQWQNDVGHTKIKLCDNIPGWLEYISKQQKTLSIAYPYLVRNYYNLENIPKPPPQSLESFLKIRRS